MSQRDPEIRIRFVKPTDEAAEPEAETSNLTLVCSPTSKPNNGGSIGTPSVTSPESNNKSRLRLAVSEFSMKLAQRIEEKCNNAEDVEKPVAKPSDRLKRLAMDVSKNVKTWSLEQQKLAGVQGEAAPIEDSDTFSEMEIRVRSCSCSERMTSGGGFVFVNDPNNSNEVSEGVDATQLSEDEFRQSASVRVPNSNHLKSLSCNENLAKLCSSKPVSSPVVDESVNRSASTLPVLSENVEADSPSNSDSTASNTNLLNTSDSNCSISPKKINRTSSIVFKAVQSQWLNLSQNKFFPAITLTFAVLFLRTIGVPDMLIGCVVGTFVTWYMFVYQQPIKKIARSSTKLESKSLNAFGKQSHQPGRVTSSALMHLAYSYNPCTFRLRYSHTCLVNLQGTILRISLLDRKSAKEVKTKFGLDVQSPNVRQLEPLTFSDNHLFDLSSCSVSLAPDCLARKRYFNKKYPILVSRRQRSAMNATDIASQAPEMTNQEFYLFTMGMREKEHWYTLLSSAAHGIALRPFDLIPVRRIASDTPKESAEPNRDAIRLSKLRTSVSMGNIGLDGETPEMAGDLADPQQESNNDAKKLEDVYQWHYLTRRQHLRWFLSQAIVLSPSSSLAWFNAFAWRIFHDIMSVEDLKKQLEDKMQAKLTKIILPRIIEPLRLTEMGMGTRMPLFKSAEAPSVDDRGLWLTFAVEYDGGLNGTIETRVNLLKAKSQRNNDPSCLGSASPVPSGNRLPRTPDPRYLDVLSRESCESCTSSSESDDDSTEPVSSASAATSHNSGHLLERLTNSRYFAKLIAIERVGKAAERVSLIPLTLRIDVNKIEGRMKFNLPPPPSDRLWIGFEDDETFNIEISLKPKVGNVELSGRTLHPIVSYLERKIIAEFKQKLVLPAMDDFFYLRNVYEDLEKLEHDDVPLSSTPFLD